VKHVYIDNREYILSRQWPDRTELVDVETGEIRDIQKEDPQHDELDAKFFNVERPLSAAFQPYRSRGFEFLTRLRELRTRVLLGKPPKKKRAKAPKQELQAGAGGTKVKRGRAKRALEVPESLLMHLPEAVRKEIMSKVKGLNK
jgi:hypothetical protein